jgi:hypothetical protein
LLLAIFNQVLRSEDFPRLKKCEQILSGEQKKGIKLESLLIELSAGNLFPFKLRQDNKVVFQSLASPQNLHRRLTFFQPRCFRDMTLLSFVSAKFLTLSDRL